jgi:hypothetical protein
MTTTQNELNNNTQTCLFCLENGAEKSEDFEQNNLCPCKYNYHKKCIEKFIVQNMYSCPLCRKLFDLNKINLQDSDHISSLCRIIINILLCIIILIIVIIFFVSRFMG